MISQPPPKTPLIRQVREYKKVGMNAQIAAQDAAVAYWGSVPCGGSVRISYVSAFTWPVDSGGIQLKSLWATAPIQTEPIPCTIAVNSKVWTVRMRSEDFPDYCALMVHEYGHLFGHPDLRTDSPKSITYPIISDQNKRVRPCVARYSLV